MSTFLLDVWQCLNCATRRGWGFTNQAKPENPRPLLNCTRCQSKQIHKYTGYIVAHQWRDYAYQYQRDFPRGGQGWRANLSE